MSKTDRARDQLRHLSARRAALDAAPAERARLDAEIGQAEAKLADLERREKASAAERKAVAGELAKLGARLADTAAAYVAVWDATEPVLARARLAGMTGAEVRGAIDLSPPTGSTGVPGAGLASAVRAFLHTVQRHRQVLKEGGYRKRAERQRAIERRREAERQARIAAFRKHPPKGYKFEHYRAPAMAGVTGGAAQPPRL